MPKEANVERRTWDEFRNVKMLWWINRTIQLFGWVIIVDVDDTGKVTNAYPARTSWRGFDEKFEDEAYRVLTEHIVENAPQLKRDVSNES